MSDRDSFRRGCLFSTAETKSGVVLLYLTEYLQASYQGRKAGALLCGRAHIKTPPLQDRGLT